MAKKKMARKKAGTGAPKPAAGKPKGLSALTPAQLAELARQKAERDAEFEQQWTEKVKQAIAATEAALANARKSQAAAEAEVARVEGVLETLHNQAAERGVAVAGATKRAAAPVAAVQTKPGPHKPAKKTKSGKDRKKRVELGVKQAMVADALKKFPKGASFREFREYLEGVMLPGTSVAVFSLIDLSSSKTFAKRLLPGGWKIVGARQEARLVKG